MVGVCVHRLQKHEILAKQKQNLDWCHLLEYKGDICYLVVRYVAPCQSA